MPRFSVMKLDSHKHMSGPDALAKLEDAANDALLLLKYAVRELEQTVIDINVSKQIDYYFLPTGEKLHAEDVAKMIEVLSLTQKGIDLGFGVKFRRSFVDYKGYVKQKNLGGMKPKRTRDYYNEVINPGGTEKKIMGAVSLKYVTLFESKGPEAVHALIHEATHKFAGTIDYVYFEGDDMLDPASKTLTTIRDKAKALNNADSYAWLAIMIGRRESIKYKCDMFWDC